MTSLSVLVLAYVDCTGLSPVLCCTMMLTPPPPHFLHIGDYDKHLREIEYNGCRCGS